MTDYSYSYTTTGDGAALAGVLAASLMVTALVSIAVYVVVVIALWKIFSKAGKPGWAALIPFYNIYVLLEVIGRPAWWLAIFVAAFLISWVPIVGFVVGIATLILYVIMMLDLGKSFNKSTTFSVVALIFFHLIGLLILGFGDAKYVGPAALKKS